MTTYAYSPMRNLFADLTANGYAWFAAIAVWQENFEFWIRVMVGVSAIVVSIVTIYYKFKNKGK